MDINVHHIGLPVKRYRGSYCGINTSAIVSTPESNCRRNRHFRRDKLPLDPGGTIQSGDARLVAHGLDVAGKGLVLPDFLFGPLPERLPTACHTATVPVDRCIAPACETLEYATLPKCSFFVALRELRAALTRLRAALTPGPSGGRSRLPSGTCLLRGFGRRRDRSRPAGGTYSRRGEQDRFSGSIRHAIRVALSTCFAMSGFAVAGAAAPADSRVGALKHGTAEQEAFFESKVRPLLAARCFRCHGEKQQKGGIRLDSAEALLGKNDDEALVKPGHPSESRVMEVIGYKDEPKMPPDGKLSDANIQILREWIRQGAHFPSKDAAAAVVRLSSPEGVIRAKETLWSLQPVKSPVPPEVKNEAWVKTPIDRFILAKLEANGLTPSPAVDRRTLLRRLSFDLIGLPPTYAEVRAFENDRSPNAIEIVVDHLLASPHYGERWGRHWLDVARYSDTKGYVFTEERRYPFSYTYRDYVIEAFNRDLPFDRFILEQLAADQLDLGADHAALAAMGFLTVGRRFSNNTNDIIDDRIDVVSRGLLGLSVTCARCHDHKFDPIPTDDYYSLHGVFESSVEPAELPLLGDRPESNAYRKYEAEFAQFQAELDRFKSAKLVEMQDQFRQKTAAYLQAAWHDLATGMGEERGVNNLHGLRRLLVRRWVIHLKRMMDSPDAVFLAWHEFAKLPEKEFAARCAGTVAKLKTLPTAATGTRRMNAVIQREFAQRPPRSMRDVAAKYGELLVQAEQRWKKLVKDSAGGKQLSALSQPEWEELRQVLYRENGPGIIAADDLRRVLDLADRQQLARLQNRLEALRINSPAAPARGMVLNDLPHPVEPVVFIRGNPGRPGKQVSRHFLQAVGDFGARPFARGSGRLELAQDIASPKNPLTARVIVNRVWMHHFGEGIVRTASDFGVRGTPPSHPELLDYLASRFMREGWSLKNLHRLILLSAVYQQSSVPRSDQDDKDPENKLLGRMNPMRLEFEPMRDSWLAVAGNLDGTVGGRGFDIQRTDGRSRRSIYAFIDRQDLPQLFRTFDFASPDVSTPERSQTTIPQQALFAMNSPFLLTQARALARLAAETDPAQRVRSLYRRVYAREPSAAELESAVTYVKSSNREEHVAGSDREFGPWEQLAQALLIANEFVFVD
jgi:cytochrome c553